MSAAATAEDGEGEEEGEDEDEEHEEDEEEDNPTPDVANPTEISTMEAEAGGGALDESDEGRSDASGAPQVKRVVGTGSAVPLNEAAAVVSETRQLPGLWHMYQHSQRTVLNCFEAEVTSCVSVVQSTQKRVLFVTSNGSARQSRSALQAVAGAVLQWQFSLFCQSVGESWVNLSVVDFEAWVQDYGEGRPAFARLTQLRLVAQMVEDLYSSMRAGLVGVFIDTCLVLLELCGSTGSETYVRIILDLIVACRVRGSHELAVMLNLLVVKFNSGCVGTDEFVEMLHAIFKVGRPTL